MKDNKSIFMQFHVSVYWLKFLFGGGDGVGWLFCGDFLWVYFLEGGAVSGLSGFFCFAGSKG